MSKNPHACTARTMPFPIAGGDWVSDGKRLIHAAAAARIAKKEAPPKGEPAEAPTPPPVTPAAARGKKECTHG